METTTAVKMAKAIGPHVLVPNPNALVVRVGSTVTCRYSGRKIKVAQADRGSVWERMEPNHPALKRNGGCFEDDSLRYVGTSYVEFEPLYISQDKHDALFT